tara:strand:- start:407 stop:700 length:294 start_codon:yes stop_codon:yes gene_type:complete
MSHVYKAIPSIEKNTNNVIIWELFGLHSAPGAEQEYYFMYDCKVHNNVKALNQWTKEEIEALYPDGVFANAFNRYVSAKNAGQNSIGPDDSFDINSL